MDCLFCKIGAGEISAHVLHEDSETIAFLDINPLAIGHTVVIPKKHTAHIMELADDLVAPLFLSVKKTAAMLGKALEAENFTIGINHGRMLGHPDLEHMHVHVIPRFEGDGGGDIHSIVKNPPKETLEEVKDKILKTNG